MAKSKLTSKGAKWRASLDWSDEDWKPYKLRAIKSFRELDELVQLFGTRKRLWSKTIIKKGKFKGLAKALHMDYDELKAELERIERRRQRDIKLYEKMKRDRTKHKELLAAGRKNEADALIKKCLVGRIWGSQHREV